MEWRRNGKFQNGVGEEVKSNWRSGVLEWSLDCSASRGRVFKTPLLHLSTTPFLQ